MLPNVNNVNERPERPTGNTASAGLSLFTLMRADLSAAEQAEAIFRRKAIYEELHPETRHGSPSVSRQVGDTRERSEADSFTSDTAAKTGQSERRVQRAAARGAALGDDRPCAISSRSIAHMSETPVR